MTNLSNGRSVIVRVNDRGPYKGDRIIDVLAIPGHQPAHLAYYDRKTAILLTGDHLYPGRLYVSDFPAYLASTRRLVEFTATRPVAHILGCHIEQSTTPFVDYPVGTVIGSQDSDLHQVSNLQDGNLDLVTLHVYSPPLFRMGTYSITGRERGEELMFVEFCDAAGI